MQKNELSMTYKKPIENNKIRKEGIQLLVVNYYNFTSEYAKTLTCKNYTIIRTINYFIMILKYFLRSKSRKIENEVLLVIKSNPLERYRVLRKPLINHPTGPGRYQISISFHREGILFGE